VLQRAQLGCHEPAGVTEFAVIERLEGDSTTDFGAPGAAPASDSRPIDAAELKRYRHLLKACWEAFDAAAAAAQGKELRKGPRGGGRELEGMVNHVLGADAGYLSALGWKLQKGGAGTLAEQLEQIRDAILKALEAAARGEIPERGPRGGVRWTARYFVRRLAWHVLDHAWEIEDRARPEPEPG
jgi:hypothetical protein